MADTGGILSGAGGLIGSVAGIFTQAANRRENRRIRAEDRTWALDDYQRQKSDNIEFWNMENEYNSPDAQRRRLEQAGYNPALALGDVNTVSKAGDVNSPQAPASPSQGAYEATNPLANLGGAVSSSIQAMSAMEGIRGQRLDNQLKEESLPWDAKKRKEDAQNASTQGRVMESQIFLQEARTETERQLARKEAALEELTKSQTALTDEQRNESVARQTNLASQTALNEQQTEESGARTEKVYTEESKLRYEIAVLKKDLDWYDQTLRSNLRSASASARLDEKRGNREGVADAPWFFPISDYQSGSNKLFNRDSGSSVDPKRSVSRYDERDGHPRDPR